VVRTAPRRRRVSLSVAASVGTQHTVDRAHHRLLQTLAAHLPEDNPLRTNRVPAELLQEVPSAARPFLPTATRLTWRRASCPTAARSTRHDCGWSTSKATRDTDCSGRTQLDSTPTGRRRPTAYRYGSASARHPPVYGLRVVIGNDGQGGAHLELLASYGPPSASAPTTHGRTATST